MEFLRTRLVGENVITGPNAMRVFPKHDHQFMGLVFILQSNFLMWAYQSWHEGKQGQYSLTAKSSSNSQFVAWNRTALHFQCTQLDMHT